MKSKRLVKVVALTAAMVVPMGVGAQDKLETSVGADLVSSYIWRGQDAGAAAIQPSVGVSYSGLSLSAWGSFGIVDRDDTKELDFTLSYSTGGLTVGVTDYFCTSGVENCPAKYFLYDAHKTAHSFEANVGYDFGPVSVNWFTTFAGVDGVTEKGKRAYASYVELAAPFKLGGLDWTASAGAVPYNDGGFYAYKNSSGFAVTSIALKASKDVRFAPMFAVPVYGILTANPSTQSLYFTVGVSL